MYLRNFPADVIKVILSFLVVLGHINSPYTYSIFSFHMPFFFILSGFFLDKNTMFKDLVVKDSKRLLFPFLIFSMLGFVIEISKRLVLNRDLSSMSEVFIDAYLFISSQAAYYGFALWFLPVLFFGKQMTFYILNRKWLLFSFLASFIIIVNLELVRYINNVPLGLGKAFFASFYIILGYLYFRSSLEIKLTTSLFSVICLLFLFDELPYFDIGGGEVPENMSQILFPIFLFSMVYPLFDLLNFLNLNLFSKIISVFTPSLMIIYLLHPYTNNISFSFVNIIFGENVWYATFWGSMVLLSPVVFLKYQFSHWKIFKYV